MTWHHCCYFYGIFLDKLFAFVISIWVGKNLLENGFLKKVVKDSATGAATDLVSDEAITSIGAKAIKRKLSGKSSKKNKTKTCKKSKQKGSGFGSLFD